MRADKKAPEGGRTGGDCVRLAQCWMASCAAAKDSNCETQGPGVFFCFVLSYVPGCKKHDRPAAVAGRKARKIMGSDGLHATEVNE